MTLLKIILSIISSVLAVSYLITGNFAVIPYMTFSLGLMMMAAGFSELEKKRKTTAYIFFIAAAFGILVSNYIFYS